MALDSILSTPVASPPPAKSVSHSQSSASSHSSFGADGASDSASKQSSGSSDSSNTNDNGNSTQNSGQNASTRNSASSNQGQNSASQAQKAASSSQSQPSTSANQAPSASTASNGKTGTAPSNTTPGTSFLQALAQSQADAQETATATTSSATPQVTTVKGKGKTKDDGSTNSAASFGFLSQSLVAAMAGIQQPNPTQGTTDSGDSVDGVSLSSGTTAQTLTADLIQNTAGNLKAAGNDGSTRGTSSTAGATDTNGANAAAASTFQAHLGVSSQSQTEATQNAANTQVNSPVGSSGFADEVGDKITWMAHQGVQSASLQMTPEHMGPVEVKISVQDGSATVSINAAHADTRAALEQALPKLREMFSTQGMNLTDASVSQQFSRGQAQKQGIKAVGSVGSVSDETSSPVVSVTSARLGLVDTYA